MLAFGHARRVVCGAQLLGALPCEVDLVVVFVGEDRGLESGVLPVGEAFRVGAQDRADPVERVVCAAAVAVDGLLHSPANLVDGLGAEFDDVERVQHRGRVVELVVDGVLVAVERVECGDLDPGTQRLAAFLEPVAIRLP